MDQIDGSIRQTLWSVSPTDQLRRHTSGWVCTVRADDTCKCQLKATGRGLLARVKRSHTTNISGLLDILKDKEKGAPPLLCLETGRPGPLVT